jgi:hypothetical protein
MKKFLIGGMLLFKSFTSSPDDLKEIKVEPQETAEPMRTYAFDDSFFAKQVDVESKGAHIVNGKLIKSKAGALGVAQFMPSTWRWLKRKGILPKNFDIENKEHQLEAQKIYMDYLYNYDYGIKYDQEVLAIAAYNAGPGRVSRLARKYGKNWIYHLPNETKDYLVKLRT